MKKLRAKLTALTLAVILLFALTVPALALNSTPPTSDDSAFSFLFFGDIQVQHSIQTDFDAWGVFAKNAVSRNPGAAFALQAGDIVESGISDDEWAAFFKNTEPALGNLPFFPTNGNHESNFLSGKPEKYLKNFNLPQNGPEGFKGEFYSFDYANAHILVVNSWVFSGEQKLTDADFARLDAWVAADLATSTATWKIVLTHVPLYPVHSDTTGNKAAEHWLPIFEKYGVSLMLVGHQHVYSRLKPMLGGAPDYENGVTQIMGNSGLKFYDSADETYAERTIYNTTTYQVFTVDGNTLTVQCFDGAGKELDYCALSPRATDVTRLAYIETLWRGAGSPVYAGESHPFSDTPKSDALTWAWKTGLVIGCGDGTFAPGVKITPAQIGIVLGRMG